MGSSRMKVSFDVVDRAKNDFTAVVEYKRDASGSFPWIAYLWDSGHLTESLNGISGSEAAIEMHVKTVVAEHTCHAIRR